MFVYFLFYEPFQQKQSKREKGYLPTPKALRQKSSLDVEIRPKRFEKSHLFGLFSRESWVSEQDLERGLKKSDPGPYSTTIYGGASAEVWPSVELEG